MSTLSDRAIPLIAISPKEIIRDVHKDLFPRRFLAALYTITKEQQQQKKTIYLRYLMLEDLLNKLY